MENAVAVGKKVTRGRFAREAVPNKTVALIARFSKQCSVTNDWHLLKIFVTHPNHHRLSWIPRLVVLPPTLGYGSLVWSQLPAWCGNVSRPLVGIYTSLWLAVM